MSRSDVAGWKGRRERQRPSSSEHILPVNSFESRRKVRASDNTQIRKAIRACEREREECTRRDANLEIDNLRAEDISVLFH